MRHDTSWMLLLTIVVGLSGCRTAPPTSAFEVAMPVRTQLVRTGGLAGEEATVAIRSDGAYIVERGCDNTHTGQLTPAALDRLRRLIAAVPWDMVERHYLDPPAPDAYTYALTLTAAGTGRAQTTVVTDATMNALPPGLARLFAALDELIAAGADE
jgi:hypothetical protein